MVALNHTVAVAMVHGADEGLRRLEGVARDERIASTIACTPSARHLLEMAGEKGRAAIEYLAAAAKTTSLPEQDI